eukprot:16552-Heterococcus_DN1.PRE.4
MLTMRLRNLSSSRECEKKSIETRKCIEIGWIESSGLGNVVPSSCSHDTSAAGAACTAQSIAVLTDEDSLDMAMAVTCMLLCRTQALSLEQSKQQQQHDQHANSGIAYPAVASVLRTVLAARHSDHTTHAKPVSFSSVTKYSAICYA